MKNRLKRLLISVYLALAVVIAVPAIPAYAAIASPDTLELYYLYAYQSSINENDQLYIAVFEIDYTVLPDADADVNFLFRFYDNGVELGAVQPYVYYNSGYSQGIVSFYFDADDPNLPDWNIDDITVKLQGNPAFTWDAGDPPSTTIPTVTSWDSTSSFLSARIVLLANQLESTYSINMIDVISGQSKLSEYGELYFETVITNLRVMSPVLFSDYVTQPVFVTTVNHSGSVDTASRAKYTGTIFDMAAIATLIGIDVSWVYAILWLLVTGIIAWAYGTKIGTVGLTWLVGICLIVGSFMGFMPTAVGISCGVLGGLFIIYPIFFKSASV